MRRILLLVLVILFVGCTDRVFQKQGDPDDKRYFSNKSYVKIEGVDFPDYARFAGWIGRSVNIMPVYTEDDPSCLAIKLYYEDYKNGSTKVVQEGVLLNRSERIIRSNPNHLLCVALCEKD